MPISPCPSPVRGSLITLSDFPGPPLPCGDQALRNRGADTVVKAAEGAALTSDYGPSLIDRKAASLVSLDANRTSPQEWHVTPKPAFDAAGGAVVRDLILDGDLGREVLRHWLVTLDLTTSRGWIRRSEQ